MFPDAKFVHIYRNPYHVFLSMKRDIEAEMSLYCVQKPKDDEVIEREMVKLYLQMFRKYFRERELIPEGNLVEVRYEDFISRPFKEVERIHRDLFLPGFEEHRSIFKDYIAEQKKIRPHSYEFDEELKNRIYNYWKYTIDMWGYEV